LNNVYVRAMNSDEFTHTDTLGRFSLKSLENDAITFSASGFETKKLKVKKLKEEAIELEFRNNPENFNKAVNNGHISENSLQKAILESTPKSVFVFN
jgi:mRNA degradation ribonuclease J1/J2